MNNNRTEIAPDAVEKAISGDRKALEELLTGIQDPVFHLSLRMLGSIPDAEDDTQEILSNIMERILTAERKRKYPPFPRNWIMTFWNRS